MYPDPNSSSQKMYDRALASLPGGNTRTTVFMKPYPIYAARGEGCRVWDLDGNFYIDCINNFTSQIHGHAHPALIKAATAQLALGSAFGLPTESEVDLAELLVSRLPSVDQSYPWIASGVVPPFGISLSAERRTSRALVSI